MSWVSLSKGVNMMVDRCIKQKRTGGHTKDDSGESERNWFKLGSVVHRKRVSDKG